MPAWARADALGACTSVREARPVWLPGKPAGRACPPPDPRRWTSINLSSPLTHPQVSLNSSALATDGSGRAASVSVSGGNKVKVKKGVAVFKDVRVEADEAGSYALRVQSASRKVAVADAVLHLVMQVRWLGRLARVGALLLHVTEEVLLLLLPLLPLLLLLPPTPILLQRPQQPLPSGPPITQPLNAVTDLRVLLPDALESGEAQAGTSAEVHVEVLTENGQPLPPDVALAALTLKVTPPGALGGWVAGRCACHLFDG